MPTRITSKHHNFRRCGLAHSQTPQTYDDGLFTEQQIAILKAEPMLVVEEIARDPLARPNAKDMIEQAKAALTIEALDGLADGEDRKSVLDAIAKRLAELS